MPISDPYFNVHILPTIEKNTRRSKYTTWYCYNNVITTEKLTWQLLLINYIFNSQLE